jgi:hypothetical protein
VGVVVWSAASFSWSRGSNARVIDARLDQTEGVFMMQTFNSSSLDAITRLMAQSDPVDLPRRAHVCRYEGDPNRRETRLPGIVTAWLQWRHLDVDVEEPLEPAKRAVKSRAHPMNSGLRLLQRTGTD